MKNIMVTGGAGFIGSNFVAYMLSKYDHYHILVYDKLTYAGNLDNLLQVSDDERYSFVRGDICDADVVGSSIDKYNIDTEDATVIGEAKAAAEKLGSPIVKISGNTDTVGSVDYNQKLSEMRAQAVAKVLEAGNTPVRAMVTEANGELKPALVTADETEEQRNRRVEIILEP